MDSRIGMLSSGQFYAYVDGYQSDPVYGTKEEVEAKLGLGSTPKVIKSDVRSTRHSYSVHMTFQHPAWDEAGGITYDNIYARSKLSANKIARKMAENDGHLASGKGRSYFTAKKCG